jgi:methylated-DNA-[protein]-cysteine S-methyltransferase
MTIYYNFYDVAGLLLIFNKENLLERIDFANISEHFQQHVGHENHEYFVRFFDNYFSKKGVELDFSRLETKGISNIYLDIYKTLSKTEFGEKITYKKLAEKAGYKNAFRATGSAMAKNRWPVLIPCHRVVGHSSPGGYSSGIGLKLKLLDLEERYKKVMNRRLD